MATKAGWKKPMAIKSIPAGHDQALNGGKPKKQGQKAEEEDEGDIQVLHI